MRLEAQYRPRKNGGTREAGVYLMLAAGAIDRTESDDLINAARLLHFAERTVDAMAKLVAASPSRRKELEMLYEAHRVRAKQIDALRLVGEMRAEPPARVQEGDWRPAVSASMETLTREFGPRPAF